MSYSKKDYKFLLASDSGLNDILSTLGYHIKYFNSIKFDLNNLHLYSPIYDLNKFFDFKNIVCHSYIPDYDSFNVIINQPIGITDDYNIRIIKDSKIMNLKEDLKKEIEEKYSQYEGSTAIHLRFYDTERRKMLFSEEFGYYKHLLKYLPSIKRNKVLIFSDCILNHNMLENINSNIIFMNNTSNINLEQRSENRRIEIRSAIEHLYIMGMCSEIYKTKGFFTNSVRLFNDKIQIKPLAF